MKLLQILLILPNLNFGQTVTGRFPKVGVNLSKHKISNHYDRISGIIYNKSMSLDTCLFSFNFTDGQHFEPFKNFLVR